MDGVWVCGSCRSINQGRGGRCYKCRTPRELVEADPAALAVAGVGSTAQPAGNPASGVGTYRSSADRAFLAQLLVGLTVVAAVLSSAMGANLVDRVLTGTVPEEGIVTVALIGLGALGVAAAALVAWAAWLSRVVANIPAVGGGWPNVSPAAAFYENFLPGLNLLRVPAIVRDVMQRLDPDGRGEPLIVAAWLGLVGGLVLPRVGGYVLAFVVSTEDDLLRLSLVLSQIALGLTVVGAVFLIAIIRWVETRITARAERLADEPSTAAS